MTDRELLEAAALAAGLHEDWPAPHYGVQWNGDGLWCFGNGEGLLWNPLTDDGDALRLAVALRIRIGGIDQRAVAFAGALECWELERGDPCAATRRAIVRAAAAMGQDTETDALRRRKD